LIDEDEWRSQNNQPNPTRIKFEDHIPSLLFHFIIYCLHSLFIKKYANNVNPKVHGPAIPPGNLSYFCEEKDLYQLFDQYAHVEDVRIIKNDSGTRSLMFGFVTLSTVHEAREMEKLLNNYLFMGRRIR
jgi:hypothetical protein